jgi:hypothetical protein
MADTQRQESRPSSEASPLWTIFDAAWRNALLVGWLGAMAPYVITIYMPQDDWLSRLVGHLGALSIKFGLFGGAIGSVLGAVAGVALLVIRWAEKRPGR